MGQGEGEACGVASRCLGGSVTDKPIVHSITVYVVGDYFDRDAFELVFVAMKNISRNLLPESAIEVRNGGMISESISGVKAGGDSGGSNYWNGIAVSDTHHYIHVREERGVEGVRSTASDRAPGGLGSRQGVDGPPGAESGSDRLTGPPRGPLEDTEEHMALHRGRRRRLLDRLKKVGAGRRFKR